MVGSLGLMCVMATAAVCRGKRSTPEIRQHVQGQQHDPFDFGGFEFGAAGPAQPQPGAFGNGGAGMFPDFGNMPQPEGFGDAAGGGGMFPDFGLPPQDVNNPAQPAKGNAGKPGLFPGFTWVAPWT